MQRLFGVELQSFVCKGDCISTDFDSIWVDKSSLVSRKVLKKCIFTLILANLCCFARGKDWLCEAFLWLNRWNPYFKDTLEVENIHKIKLLISQILICLDLHL